MMIPTQAMISFPCYPLGLKLLFKVKNEDQVLGIFLYQLIFIFLCVRLFIGRFIALFIKWFQLSSGIGFAFFSFKD